MKLRERRDRYLELLTGSETSIGRRIFSYANALSSHLSRSGDDKICCVRCGETMDQIGDQLFRLDPSSKAFTKDVVIAVTWWARKHKHEDEP